MRNGKRTPIMLALAGMLASLVTFVSPGTAVAAETISELLFPPVTTKPLQNPQQMTTSPQGEVTIGCELSFGQDLTTYNA